MKIAASIYKEVEKEKKGARLGLSAEELKKEKLLDLERREKEEEGSTAQLSDSAKQTQKMLAKYPHVQGELYKIVLNRIKSNLHLVL